MPGYFGSINEDGWITMRGCHGKNGKVSFYINNESIEEHITDGIEYCFITIPVKKDDVWSIKIVNDLTGFLGYQVGATFYPLR